VCSPLQLHARLHALCNDWASSQVATGADAGATEHLEGSRTARRTSCKVEKHAAACVLIEVFTSTVGLPSGLKHSRNQSPTREHRALDASFAHTAATMSQGVFQPIGELLPSAAARSRAAASAPATLPSPRRWCCLQAKSGSPTLPWCA
jgi:hypothetical protein